MKTIGMFVFLLFVFGMVASAATLSVITVGDRDGYSGAGGAVVDGTGDMFYIGDPHPSNVYFDYGVVKYALPTELAGKTVLDASVHIRVIALGAGEDGYTHILLQKYTFDNTTAVNAADCTTTQAQNIGVYSAVPGSFMAWDVTAALQSDIDNGFQYSAYRAVAVVSPTDLTPVAITGAYYARCASAESPLYHTGWDTLVPRLDVEYVPEPATLAVLALGMLSVIRRKR